MAEGRPKGGAEGKGKASPLEGGRGKYSPPANPERVTSKGTVAQIPFRSLKRILDHSKVRFTANPKLAFEAQRLDLRPFRFTKNGCQKFFNIRSMDSGNNPESTEAKRQWCSLMRSWPVCDNQRIGNLTGWYDAGSKQKGLSHTERGWNLYFFYDFIIYIWINLDGRAFCFCLQIQNMVKENINDEQCKIERGQRNGLSHGTDY
jgi:hypothetical protein